MWGYGRQDQHKKPIWILGGALLLSTACMHAQTQSQVFVVQPERVNGTPTFKPTAVVLDEVRLTPRTRQEIITLFASEQGFARRALPLGARGLLLHANGALSPDGLDYTAALQKNGISAHAGDRIIISDLKIEPSKIVFEFNGGPEKKHKILRHISVGMGPMETPLAADDGQIPVGSRLTLVFDKYVPEMTGDELRGLIQPIIDFSVKTPVEAYTDTLPPKLKTAILNHQVLVGMDRKMVLYAVGQPLQKVREQDSRGQFEEWIYGEAPKPTQFVRFSNSRVIRVEIAEVGLAPVIRDQDETDGFLANPTQRDVYMGDARAGVDGESRKRAAPTLRLPGEQLPQSPMQPVEMPKGTPSQQPAPPPIPPPPASQVFTTASL